VVLGPLFLILFFRNVKRLKAAAPSEEPGNIAASARPGQGTVSHPGGPE
jgi:hypothetical protein